MWHFLSHFRRVQTESSIKEIWFCSFALTEPCCFLPAEYWSVRPYFCLLARRTLPGGGGIWNEISLWGQLGITLQICLQLLMDYLDYKVRDVEEKHRLIPNAKHRWKVSHKIQCVCGGWLENSASSNCNCFFMNMFIKTKQNRKQTNKQK